MLRAAALLAGRQAAGRLRQAGATGALGAQRQGFAAAAEEPARIQVPIQVYGIPGRYAGALYMAGARADVLEDVEEDLIQVYNTAVDSSEFLEFLKDPSIPKAQKKPVLESILQKLNCHEITMRFFSLLADNNRLGHVMDISNTFDEIMSAERGEVIATITTAQAMTDGDRSRLKTALNKMVEEDESLVIQEKVDPSIVGGFVLGLGDRVVDLSISTRIKRVQQMIRDGAT